MARLSRFYIKDQPQHIIHRGNNRIDIFRREDDYLFYFKCLTEAVQQHKLKIHSYVLMTNHVHLLASPLDETSIPKTLQSLGRRYVQKIKNMNIRLEITKFSKGALIDMYYKQFLLTIVVSSIFILNISDVSADSEIKQTTSQLKQWEIIFPTRFKLIRYLAKTDEMIEVESKPRVERLKKYIKEGKTVLSGRLCESANAVLKAILCGSGKSALIDYTKDEIIKKYLLSGKITPDGKYIIAGNGGVIQDIATEKKIRLSYENEQGESQFGLDYPTTPKPDGIFAFRLWDEQGRETGYIGEANLYEMVKLNGRGFKVKVIQGNGKMYGQVTGSSGYIGNGKYMYSPIGIESLLVNWERNTIGRCSVSHDGDWAACTLNEDKTKKTGWILINTRERKVVKHWPNLKAKDAIWVWVGPVDQHPGFVR